MSTVGLPWFSNPHHLVQQSELVSRASLFGSTTVGTNNVDDTSQEYAEQIRRLESLVEERLGDLPDQRPRKRRKLVNGEDAAGEEPIAEKAEGEGSSKDSELRIAPAFRLLSSSLPPRSIHLDPLPIPKRIVWEPPCEDSDYEAQERASKAASIAVDASWLFSESRQAYIPRPNEARKVLSIHVTQPPSTTDTSQLPALVLLEQPRPRSQSSSMQNSLIPSPHESKTNPSTCQIIQIQLDSTTTTRSPASSASTPSAGPHLTSSSRKRQFHAQHFHHSGSSRTKSSQRRKNLKEHKPARFWRPVYGWGGKSMGYAMGYEGSWAVYPEEGGEDAWGTRGYVRDTMKKGIYGDVWPEKSKA